MPDFLSAILPSLGLPFFAIGGSTANGPDVGSSIGLPGISS
ncbi:hypothetical protein [Rhodococcus sp. NPDC059234]